MWNASLASPSSRCSGIYPPSKSLKTLQTHNLELRVLLTLFWLFFAHSRRTLRWILPLGDFGTSSMNWNGQYREQRVDEKALHTITPPSRRLYLTTLSEVQSWTSLSVILPLAKSLSTT